MNWNAKELLVWNNTCCSESRKKKAGTELSVKNIYHSFQNAKKKKKVWYFSPADGTISNNRKSGWDSLYLILDIWPT